MVQHYKIQDGQGNTSAIISKTFNIIDELSPDALTDISEIYYRKFENDNKIKIQQFSIDDFNLTFEGIGISATIEFPNDNKEKSTYNLVLETSKSYIAEAPLTLKLVSEITSNLPEFGIDVNGVYTISKSLVFHPPDTILNENQKIIVQVIRIFDGIKNNFYFIDRNLKPTLIIDIIKNISDYIMANGFDSSLIKTTSKQVKIVDDFINESSFQFKEMIDDYGQKYYKCNVDNIGDFLFEKDDNTFVRMRKLNNNSYSSIHIIENDFTPMNTFIGNPNFHILLHEPKEWISDDIHYPPSHAYSVMEIYRDFEKLEDLVWVGIMNVKNIDYLTYIYYQKNGIYTCVFDKNTKNRANPSNSLAGEKIVKHYITSFDAIRENIYKKGLS